MRNSILIFAALPWLGLAGCAETLCANCQPDVVGGGGIAVAAKILAEEDAQRPQAVAQRPVAKEVVSRARCAGNDARGYSLVCLRATGTQACFYQADDGSLIDCVDEHCATLPPKVRSWCETKLLAQSPPAPALDSLETPHVFIQVTGPNADDGKAQRCVDVILQHGGVFDPAAPVRAVLYLEDDQNRLQIISSARGVIRDEPRPGWTMQRLCENAFSLAVATLQRDLLSQNRAAR